MTTPAFFLASVAFPTVKGADAVQTFLDCGETHGFPAAFLSDNGAVFSGKSRKGKVALESELERIHQTLKRFLSRQLPPASLALLQAQLDAFRTYYNNLRPHRALGGHTPIQAFNAHIKALSTPE